MSEIEEPRRIITPRCYRQRKIDSRISAIILFSSLRQPVRARRRRKEYTRRRLEKREGRGCAPAALLRAWVRRDVTGIAILNYAMFLFFFQREASRSARREFSHAPEVPNGAYATNTAFPGISPSLFHSAPRELRGATRAVIKRFDLEVVPFCNARDLESARI